MKPIPENLKEMIGRHYRGPTGIFRVIAICWWRSPDRWLVQYRRELFMLDSESPEGVKKAFLIGSPMLDSPEDFLKDHKEIKDA